MIDVEHARTNGGKKIRNSVTTYDASDQIYSHALTHARTAAPISSVFLIQKPFSPAGCFLPPVPTNGWLIPLREEKGPTMQPGFLESMHACSPPATSSQFTSCGKERKRSSMVVIGLLQCARAQGEGEREGARERPPSLSSLYRDIDLSGQS